MKLLHFPVRGHPPGDNHRDGLRQPGSQGEHVRQERYRAAREPGKPGFGCPGCGATTADSDLILIGWCGTGTRVGP
jgi:hypothetical protein